MLQDSLHVLATEHHELERTISRRPSVLSSMEEEFFDCDDEEVFSPAGSPVTEEFVDAMSRDVPVNSTSNHASSNHSNGDATPHYGRSTLPVAMFSRSDFSLWSILKQCIGKVSVHGLYSL
ncbi:oxysterol-binding protein, partial [Elysia marginata]